MLQPTLGDLTNFLLIRLQGGGSDLQVLVLTIQFGNLPALSLDLLGILLVLGISVVAAVLVGFLTHGPTVIDLVGTFLWALLGISVFILLIPFVWNGDLLVHGLPLFAALIGAFVALLIRQLLSGGFRRRRPVVAGE
ncbi:MAG TPA: hypothetical protein VH599_12125 [Ktedonobacterales bacterium]